MEKLGLNKRQNNAIQYLKEHNKLTNKEYVQINQSISNKTAWRDLNELIEKNIIAAHGSRKQRYYMLR